MVKPGILFGVLFFSSPSNALNFNSTDLKLVCPQRGVVEVTLHLFGHVSELWDKNYEIGAGHVESGNMDIIRFVNGDVLFHNKRTEGMFYHYYDNPGVISCSVLSENPVHPLFN